jgi:excisionase family DNA binding protein
MLLYGCQGGNLVSTYEHDVELLSIPKLAAYLSLAERTVVMWAQQGRIPAFKVGSIWRFRKEDIDKWLESQRTGPDLGTPEEDTVGTLKPKPFRSIEDEQRVAGCIDAIKLKLQDSDRHMWVVYDFHLDYEERVVKTAIDRLVKAKKIKRGVQQIQDKKIPVITRRDD